MNNITTTFKDGRLTISISGQFTFAQFKDFSAAYKNPPGTPMGIEIDLQRTEYIDSAALGMLMSMRKNIAENIPIRLHNAKPRVLKILKIASFDKKFQLS